MTGAQRTTAKERKDALRIDHPWGYTDYLLQKKKKEEYKNKYQAFKKNSLIIK